jgi:hypothetical protein
LSEKTCEVCSRKISLDEHPSGFVFRDEVFVCQTCADKHSHGEISKLTKTIMQKPYEGMPIALWLIHEQNKDKTMMTVKNKKL